MLLRLYRTVFRPNVRDRAGVRRYVVAVTVIAWGIAVSADLAQYWMEGGALGRLLLEEAMTLATVLVTAIPMSITIGNAQLNLHLARHEAERLSCTDSLTGLPNRRAFFSAAAEFKGAVALAIADIDRFKRINDAHGHTGGDAALTALAHIMRDELSDLGPVARLGGEEFGWICGEADAAKVKERLQRMRQRVAEARIGVGGETVALTVSTGFAVGTHAEIDALYSAADRALYVAKSAGRDRVVAFDEIGVELRAGRVRQAG